jgi:short-chain fatty acids transporter
MGKSAIEKESAVERFAKTFEAVIPDALTASLFMLIFVVILGLALGIPIVGKVTYAGTSYDGILDAFYKGLWMLLAFVTQMSLIALFGGVLARAPLLRRALDRLALLPNSPAQAIALIVIITAILGYVHWGLAVILGPIFAAIVCMECERKGIKVDFLVALASAYIAHSIWQLGISSSAPLIVATKGHFLEAITGVMPLTTTIWSPAAVTFAITATIAFAIYGILIHKGVRVPKTISEYPDAVKAVTLLTATDGATSGGGMSEKLTFGQRLERSRVVAILLALFLLVWVIYEQAILQVGYGINTINTIFFMLALLLHGNIYNFSRAVADSVRAVWPILVIYNVYAGIGAIFQYTPLGYMISAAIGAVATPLTYPFLMWVAGTIVAIFVPSSGGQWIIQGLITVKSAEMVGVSYQRGLLSLGVGDQQGNLWSPFWYIVATSVVGMDFRKIFGFGFLAGFIWAVLGILCYTFLPV